MFSGTFNEQAFERRRSRLMRLKEFNSCLIKEAANSIAELKYVTQLFTQFSLLHFKGLILWTLRGDSHVKNEVTKVSSRPSMPTLEALHKFKTMVTRYTLVPNPDYG